MYTDFYGLREKPFDLTPSTRFLYLGEIHKEALALLTYGVVERKGFVLLTGEVGTGKTTIVHALLSNLGQRLEHVHLANPLVTPQEFIEYLSLRALNRTVPFRSKAEFLIQFEAFLKDCHRRGKCFVLIVDEAHRLSFDLLEEIRLLSNMETSEEKLISVFLVGQPELNRRLKEPRCRPLFQRIGIQYHIRPLDWTATREYVRTRLQVAGADDPGRIFPDEVVRLVYRFAKGYPRAINTLSDNVLLLGYSRGTKRITPAMVEECGRDMSLQAPEPEPEPAGEELPPTDGEEECGRLDTPTEPPARTDRGSRGRRRFTLAFAVLLAVVIVGLIRTEVHERNPPGRPSPSPIAAPKVSEPLYQVPGTATGKTDPTPAPDQPPGEEKEEPEGPRAGNAEQESPPGSSPGASEEMTEADRKAGSIDIEPPAASLGQGTHSATVARERDALPIAITVKKGDTLRELAMEVYGRVDRGILQTVKETNPEIEDIDLILVGQRIVFPALLPGSTGEIPALPSQPVPRQGDAAIDPSDEVPHLPAPLDQSLIDPARETGMRLAQHFRTQPHGGTIWRRTAQGGERGAT